MDLSTRLRVFLAQVMLTLIKRPKSRCGETNGRHRLTAAAVVAIRQLFAANPDRVRRPVAESYGISERHLNNILCGAKWASAGGPLQAQRVDADDMEFDESLLIRCAGCRARVYASKADRTLCTLCARGERRAA